VPEVGLEPTLPGGNRILSSIIIAGWCDVALRSAFMGLLWLVCGMLRVHVRPDCHQNRHQSRPDERFPEGVETGRVWGTRNEEMLPVRSETKVSLKDA